MRDAETMSRDQWILDMMRDTELTFGMKTLGAFLAINTVGQVDLNTQPLNTISQDDLANGTGLSDEGVRNAIKGLERRGWVTVERRRRPCAYTIKARKP